MNVHLSVYWAVFIAVAACSAWAAEPISKTELPERVREYTSRVSECIHWAGEVDSGTADPVHAAEIARAIEALHCKDLEAEAAFLHKKYRKDARVIKAVDVATRDWLNTLGKSPPDGKETAPATKRTPRK